MPDGSRCSCAHATLVMVAPAVLVDRSTLVTRGEQQQEQHPFARMARHDRLRKGDERVHAERAAHLALDASLPCDEVHAPGHFEAERVVL